MDAVLFLRQAARFQSRALERVEDVHGLRSSAQSRLWSTRGGCAGRQEVAVFGLRLARTRLPVSTNSAQYFLGPRFVGIEEIMNSVPALSSLQNFQLAAGNTVGRTHVRHAGHYRRAHRLWLFRASADAPASRDLLPHCFLRAVKTTHNGLPDQGSGF